MKSSEPPRLATWLLEHLAQRSKNEGLAGDLVEEFRQGRSVGWYWRQVLGAIVVRFSNEMHAQGGAIGFALGWTCAAAVLWPHIWISSHLQLFFAWGTRHNGPESPIRVTAIEIAAMAVILWAALSLYLAIVRSFDLKRFTWGLFVGLLALVAGNVIRLVFSGLPHSHFHIAPDFPKTRWDHYVYEWGPWFGALLLSMWTARPSLASRNPNKIVA
jgi:exosortase/archaeosortase family protein